MLNCVALCVFIIKKDDELFEWGKFTPKDEGTLVFVSGFEKIF